MGKSFCSSLTIHNGLVQHGQMSPIQGADLPPSGVVAASFSAAVLTVDSTGRITSISGSLAANPPFATVPKWSGTAWVAAFPVFGFTTDIQATITGGNAACIVIGLQGRRISSAAAAPSDGQVLGWVAADSQWELKNLFEATSLTGAKGGNVALANLITLLANLGILTDNTT